MISYELRNKVIQYIQSEISIEEFEKWLVPRLPIYLRHPNSSEAELVAIIELGFADINNGIRNENKVKKELMNNLPKTISISQPNVETWSSNSTSTTQHSDSIQEITLVYVN